MTIAARQRPGQAEDGTAHASRSAADSFDNLTLPENAGPDLTRVNGHQRPGQAEDDPAYAPRSAADSTDNPRLPQDAGVIARLRADLVKAERRADRAEAKLAKSTRKRPKRVYETPEFAKGVERYLRAWGLRVAAGDPSDLKRLHEFRQLYAAALRVGVQGQHDNGTSWTAIGDALGITRQGARQQWGGPTEHASGRGQQPPATATPDDTDLVAISL